MLHSPASMSAAARSHATRSESSAEHAKGRARSLQKHEAKQEGQDKPGWKGRQEVFRTPTQEGGVAETPRPPSPPPPPVPSSTQYSRLILSPPPLRSIIPLTQLILTTSAQPLPHVCRRLAARAVCDLSKVRDGDTPLRAARSACHSHQKGNRSRPPVRCVKKGVTFQHMGE